jgi:DNA-binding beta-propeller fold protein YncE
MREVTDSQLVSHTALVGAGGFTYLASCDWCRLPAGQSWLEVVAVATDSRDRVYVFSRSEHPVCVFEPDGTFLYSWGEGLFVRPHGITIGPDDAVYCTDDTDHTVRKYTPEGRLLLTLGTSGRPSNTGATSVDYREILRAGPPFNYPTNLARAADGTMYITDGYGNARVHKFSPDGELLQSWGEPGAGPGQFHVPHGIAIDAAGTVYVADRENSRLQRFTPHGEFIDQWTDVARPSEVFIDRVGNVFVAELGYRAGMFPGNEPPGPDATGGRMSVFSPTGQLQARWGGGDNPCAAGDFFAPHDIWIDARGDLYVSEVTYTAGISRGAIGPDAHTLQKFTCAAKRTGVVSG